MTRIATLRTKFEGLGSEIMETHSPLDRVRRTSHIMHPHNTDDSLGLATAAGQAVAAGRFNPAPVDSLQTQSSILQLAVIVPIVLDIGAFHLAWSRIKRGEIPGSIAVTGTPTC